MIFNSVVLMRQKIKVCGDRIFILVSIVGLVFQGCTEEKRKSPEIFERKCHFERSGNVGVDTGYDYISSSIIDELGGYAYFGTSSGKIIKVSLSSLIVTDVLSLPSEEFFLFSAALDTSNGYAYFGTWTVPGRIIKIRLSDFTRVASLTIPEDRIETSLVDIRNGFGYFSAKSVFKIKLADFSIQEKLPLFPIRGYISSGSIDQTT